MKTYFKSVSNLLKIWFYFIFVSWIFLVDRASEARLTSYKLKDENLMKAVVQALLLSLAVLGFVCVLVFCEPFLYLFDASLGLCVQLSCNNNCL